MMILRNPLKLQVFEDILGLKDLIKSQMFENKFEKFNKITSIWETDLRNLNKITSIWEYVWEI